MRRRVTPPFLTDVEIAAATEPLTQGAARVNYLRELGLHVQVKPNGQPLVGRSHFEEVMKGRILIEGAANDQPGGVNIKALRERVRYARGA